MKGKVLVIAGSDSGGGAGIQADIKTINALGGFAATSITALTAQNTLGVHEIYPVEVSFIAKQMVVVLDDIGADCIKTGMLHNIDVINVVADTIEKNAEVIPLVADPVMMAKGGAILLDEESSSTLIKRIIPLASVLTPNAPEASMLTGIEVIDVNSQKKAGEALLKMGAKAVLVKGAHIQGTMINDLLLMDDSVIPFTGPRINTLHTHGTGCTLASAIAAGLAKGDDLVRAVTNARLYLLAAITTAPGFGSGHGPVNHSVTVDMKRIIT